MAAALLLAAALLAGVAWAGRLPGRLFLPERLAAAAIVGVLAAGWASWLLVLAGGFRFAAVAAPVLLLVLAVVGWRRGRDEAQGTAIPRRLYAWWLGTTAPVSVLLVYLDSTHFLPALQGGWGSAGSSWGDLALHASLAARFSQEARFEWDFPLLAGAPLTYPFLPDFLSGVLHRGGASLRWGLLAPTLVLGLALVQLLFFLGWRAARSRRAALLVVLLVLFDGSAAGLAVLWRELRESGLPLFAYLRAIRHDFAHVPALNVRFSNIVCDALLPQRGMLAGLAAFLLATVLLRSAWEQEARAARRAAGPLSAARSRRRARGTLVAAGALLGSLPFEHVHTFLVLAGVMGWMALARCLPWWRGDGRGEVGRPGSAPWPWAAALGLGLALAAPQLAWQLSHSFGQRFSRWQLSWMVAPGESPFAFWARNLGVLLPFLAAAPWWLRRWPARGFWLHLLAPCLALFAVANVYLFQPHAYDNLKLLFYAYLALAVGAARLLAGWWRRGGWAQAAAALCVVLATASGGVSILRESLLHWPLLDGDEVALGMALRLLTPADARFLTADNHDHPVPVVAGRRIVLGYRGWLWTYGLDVGPVLADVRTMYGGGPEAAALLRRYGVGYVVVGPPERRAFAVDESFFARRYPLLLARGAYRVYSLGTKTVAPAGSLPAKRSASK